MAAGVAARGDGAEPGRLARGDREPEPSPSRRTERPFTPRSSVVTPVSPPLPELPDLVVDLTSDEWTVTNAGTAAAGPFLAEIGNEDGVPFQYEFGPLEPEGTRTEEASLCQTGTWIVHVDPDNLVEELDDDNNTDTEEGYVC
jgi:hypothetical protein